MAHVFSVLLDGPCDSYSEEWRHECECRWLLMQNADPIQMHLYLYGVEHRSEIVTKDASGQERLTTDHARKLKEENTKPLYAYRGLQAADRLLGDAMKLKGLQAAGGHSLTSKSDHA